MPAIGTPKLVFACSRITDEEFGDLTLKACRGVDHEEAKIGRDKFVAAAAGVQLPSERAEFMDQCAFDEMVNVFSGRAVEKRWIVVELGRDRIERFECVANLDFGEDADLLQRARPRAIDGQLIGQQAPVERKRTLERVERFVGLALEAAAPEAVVFAVGIG